MAIFRREGDRATPAPDPLPPRTKAPSSARAAATVIASCTRIVGEITGSTSLTIEGQFEGIVQIDSEVTVAPDGKAQGEIAARSVRVGGKMVGDVRGKDLVEITPSGSLEGNITAARVIIAEGAFFKGQVQMGSPAAAPGAAREAQPEDPRRSAPTSRLEGGRPDGRGAEGGTGAGSSGAGSGGPGSSGTGSSGAGSGGGGSSNSRR